MNTARLLILALITALLMAGCYPTSGVLLDTMSDDGQVVVYWGDDDDDATGDDDDTTDEPCNDPEDLDCDGWPSCPEGGCVTGEYDCDDNDPDINPDVAEDCDTAWDDNCNGTANGTPPNLDNCE
jgi:hypothetical protein